MALRIEQLEAREAAFEAEEPMRTFALDKRELALEQRELAIEQKIENLLQREGELRYLESVLAKEELDIAERRWTLNARRDEPAGEMAKVFEALTIAGKENIESSEVSENLSQSVAGTVFFGSESEEAAWLKVRMKEMKRRLLKLSTTVKMEGNSDRDVLALAAHADDLREHLRVMRLKADLAGVMKLVNEVATDVASMEAKGVETEAEDKKQVRDSDVTELSLALRFKQLEVREAELRAKEQELTPK
jgi:hypothetical protein